MALFDNFIAKAFPALPRLFNARLPAITPRKAMGVSGTPVYAGYVLTPERSPKLVGQEKYRTFADILANISIVAAGVRYFLNIVARPSWSAEAADTSDEAKQYQEFVEDVLFEDLHTPWSRVVRRSGTYRFYGFAAAEWIANRRDDGKIGFHDIESRPQWTIWRWEVDERGYVEGLWQRDPLTGRELGLPRGKVMYLVDDTLTDSPEGMGLLRHIVEPAERLKEYLEQERYGFLRDLRGIPIAKAPLDELAAGVQAGTITPADRDKAVNDMLDFVKFQQKTKDLALLMNSQPYISRTDTGNVITQVPKWEVALVSGTATGLADMGKAIERLNFEMARILGIEQLMIGATSAGSFALAKEKSTALYLLANSVLRDIRLQAQHDLIWPLWKLNGFPDEMMPQLKAEDVAPRDVEQVARVLRDMAVAGSPMTPDDEVQNFVRDLLGAPHIDLAKLAQMTLGNVETGGGEPPVDQSDESGLGDAGGGEGPDADTSQGSFVGGGFGKVIDAEIYKAKQSKKSAGYRNAAPGVEQCRHCSMFEKPDRCSAVRGEINPVGWCELFESVILKKVDKYDVVITLAEAA